MDADLPRVVDFMMSAFKDGYYLAKREAAVTPETAGRKRK